MSKVSTSCDNKEKWVSCVSRRRGWTDLGLRGHIGGRGCWWLRNCRRSGNGWVVGCQRVSRRIALISVQCLRVDTCDPIMTCCDRVGLERVLLSQE